MASGSKKGQSPTGRTNNRLHDDGQFAVMRWFDKNRDRVHEKMTYPEIVEAVAAETGVAVTKGNIEGAMKDFGLRVRPLPTASPLTRAGAERVRTDPGRIVLTAMERYNLRCWADDNRDRIHRKMTYEDMAAEVQQRIGLTVGRGNLRSILKPLGLVAKKNFQDCPVGLTGTPDGEPVPGEPTTGRSGAYKRVARMVALEQRVAALEGRPAFDPADTESVNLLARNVRQLTESLQKTVVDVVAISGRLVTVEDKAAFTASRIDALAKTSAPARLEQAVTTVHAIRDRIAQDLSAQEKLHDHDLSVIRSQMSEVMQRLRDLEGAIIGPGK